MQEKLLYVAICVCMIMVWSVFVYGLISTFNEKGLCVGVYFFALFCIILGLGFSAFLIELYKNIK